MPVYKDECVYSFDSVESPAGIDVCLVCNLAFSPARGFTQLHTALSTHDAFVNIRKTPRERPKKQIKLAIDAQADSDLWDTHTTIERGSMDQKEAETRAQAVLNADSYNKEQEIVAWELEIEVCAHAAIEQQEPVAAAASAPRTCSQCDLDSNLWLCLVCGTLSCGRQQFGGGGGNGHAVSHFSSTQHPIAVKIGSITPDGHADVYCYACDEERKDPEIKKHLETFGISLADTRKTEKSMAELQLEQNSKFDFSMHDAQGSDLLPVSGPGLTGMRNLGNTCYLNSVLQCLMALPPFANEFPKNTPDRVIGASDPPNNLALQLSKLQYALNSGDYATQDPHSEQGYQRGVVPAMLKYLVGRGHPEFSTMRQQDAFEFLAYLLSKITQDAKASGKPDPVAKLFGFESSRRIQCTACDSVKYKTEPQESLSIQVPIERTPAGFKTVSFDDLIKVETSSESIELSCPVCKSKQNMLTTFGFNSFPEVLVLNVRRFELLNWVPQKVDVPVQVPSEIDLKPYKTTHQDGEKLMPEEDKLAFEPNRDVLDQLTAMGFPFEKCVEALQATGNADPEAAMNWLLLPEDQQTLAQPASGASPEQIGTLQAMGFTEVQARAALHVKNNNVQEAVEWLFSGNAENAEQILAAAAADDQQQKSPLGDPDRSNYTLKGIICHKGGSVHAGHYVAFIRKKGNWYLYNDEKVVEGADIDEMQKFAYLYIFERT